MGGGVRRGRHSTKYAECDGPILTPEQRASVFEKWKEIRGPMHEPGRHGTIPLDEAVPHLAASLESLIEQGYSGPHIAEMFGVPRHTVYSWAKTLDLKIPKRPGWGRLWSWEHMRFLAVPGPALDALPFPVRPKSLAGSERQRRIWASMTDEERSLRRQQLASVRNPAKARAVYGASRVGLRAESKARRRERAATRATCRKGHPWTPENQYRAPGHRGYAECRQCRREANLRFRQKRITNTEGMSDV